MLEFAMELRERVKDQLYRIDETFERVDFAYHDLETGTVGRVQTLEEVECRRRTTRWSGAVGDSGNAFALESQLPEMRLVKQFEITYLRVG